MVPFNVPKVKVGKGWALMGRRSAVVELRNNGVLVLKLEGMDWLGLGVDGSG